MINNLNYIKCFSSVWFLASICVISSFFFIGRIKSNIHKSFQENYYTINDQIRLAWKDMEKIKAPEITINRIDKNTEQKITTPPKSNK